MSKEHSPARAFNGPVELHNNDPPDRIIGEHECHRLTDLSRSTRWRMMKQGQFPKKIRLSPNRGGWRLSAIIQWLESREAAA